MCIFISKEQSYVRSMQHTDKVLQKSMMNRDQRTLTTTHKTAKTKGRSALLYPSQSHRKTNSPS